MSDLGFPGKTRVLVVGFFSSLGVDRRWFWSDFSQARPESGLFGSIRSIENLVEKPGFCAIPGFHLQNPGFQVPASSWVWLFPGRFRRRKSDSLGPRPASVSSLRARVHTHVDAQHEAGHLTQAASAEQINRRTDTARVSERPRPGGNAGQSSRKFLPRKMCPPREQR